jgi:hypothetical protein
VPALKANVHMNMRCPCPAPTECDFSRSRHSTVGDLPRFGFFRLLRGHSRRLFTGTLLSCGMCLVVLLKMQTAHCTEYELTTKLQPVFLLLLCYVTSVYSSLNCLWATTLSDLEIPILSKCLNNFCLLSFRRPNSV